MLYFAALVLVVGLAAKFRSYWRTRTPLQGSAVELASEVVLFRKTFFNDRLAWIFAVCFHFGLLLVLARHLRYALDPDWIGEFIWRLVVIVQPFGLYGGFVLLGGIAGFWLRKLLVGKLRRASRLVDHLLLGLMLSVGVVGYINAFIHTDIVAVKAFFIGLATFNWQPLPTDAFLLLHLWLVACIMCTLPFGKMLHLPGVVDLAPTEPELGHRRWKLIGAALAAVLLIPAGVAATSVAAEGWTKAQPDFSKLARAHKADDPTVMIRSHPSFLFGHRSVVVYTGARTPSNTIEQCVTCHITKGSDGEPVDIDNSKHFCVACHYKAAVTIDCFECHNSKPVPEKTSSLPLPDQLAAAIAAHLAEGSIAR